MGMSSSIRHPVHSLTSCSVYLSAQVVVVVSVSCFVQFTSYGYSVQYLILLYIYLYFLTSIYHVTSGSVNFKCLRPRTGYYKANVDTALNFKNKTLCLGLVIHDSEGLVMAYILKACGYF